MDNNYLDEGYVKYHCEWQVSDAMPMASLQALNACRQQMYDLGLIGFYAAHGVGYGNISQRWLPTNNAANTVEAAPLQFAISGTQTGHLPALTAEHYSLVSSVDIAANQLICKGPIKASSEALTHAAVYGLHDDYQVVIHVHHLFLWKQLLHKIPTSNADVPYGTPEMAYEIARLYEEENLAQHRIMAMAGHREGIISFGATFEEATAVILKHFNAQ